MTHPIKERPILFNGAMVRALLAGTKTQTRRVVTPQPDSHPGMNCTRLVFKNRKGMPLLDEALEAVEPVLYRSLCPYGQTGERLWVRENGWQRPELSDRDLREGADTWPPYEYDAEPLMCWEDGELKRFGWKRRPSIHMPRWASRITLEITEVRVERLQDISEADARAEGITDGGCTKCGMPEPCDCAAPAPSAREAFAHLWMSINGADSWHANPWVWAVGFRRLP